jgi:hypothetical protein
MLVQHAEKSSFFFFFLRKSNNKGSLRHRAAIACAASFSLGYIVYGPTIWSLASDTSGRQQPQILNNAPKFEEKIALSTNLYAMRGKFPVLLSHLSEQHTI